MSFADQLRGLVVGGGLFGGEGQELCPGGAVSAMRPGPCRGAWVPRGPCRARAVPGYAG